MPDIRIPRDGAIFWFEDSEYREHFAGRLAAETRNEVTLYSSFPHIDKDELPNKSKEANAFRQEFLND